MQPPAQSIGATLLLKYTTQEKEDKARLDDGHRKMRQNQHSTPGSAAVHPSCPAAESEPIRRPTKLPGTARSDTNLEEL